MKKETTFAAAITIIYLVASLIGILHHELWLDESQHWLLAMESSSFPDLMHNLRFEGHPVLWDSLVFCITRFTHNPSGMQLLHIAVSTVAAFVFLGKAPFPRIFRVLFVFGYFMLFEYNVISRNYILGILFLFLACSAFKDREKKFTLLCLYLALAANVHLMFAVVSTGFFCTLLFERLVNKPPRVTSPRVIGHLVFMAGMAAVFIQIAETDSNWFFDSISNIPWQEKFSKGYISLFKGIMTVPDFRGIHFWNTNLLVNLSKPLAGALGLLVWLLPLFLFFRNRTVLFFVYITLIGIQLFFFITQRAAVRFDGITYIIIIMGLCLAKYFPQQQMPEKFQHTKKLLVYAILSIQMTSGVLAYTFDYIYPFTAAKNVASFLKHNHLENANLVTVTCDGTMISPYIGKKIYFLSEKKQLRYCNWGTTKGIFAKDSITAMLTDYVTEKGNAVLLSGFTFTNTSPVGEWQPLNEKIKVKLLAAYNDNIIENSKFSIYEVSLMDNPKPN